MRGGHCPDPEDSTPSPCEPPQGLSHFYVPADGALLVYYYAALSKPAMDMDLTSNRGQIA
jgi:hypothetical protein